MDTEKCGFVHICSKNSETRADHIANRPSDQAHLVLNSIEKVKPSFLISLMCMILNRKGQSSDLTAFTYKIEVFYRPEWTKGGTP